MHVALVGVWDQGPGYPRTTALQQALERLGHRVSACRVDPPATGSSKVALLSRPWRWPGYALASRRTRRDLLRSFRRLIADPSDRPDVVLVPYPGHAAVQWLRSVWDGPLVLDLFLSAYTTTVVDRQLLPKWSPPARLLRRLDTRACHAADVVLLDTPQHAGQVAELTGLPQERFSWVPVADPDAPNRATSVPMRGAGEPLRLLFFGTGVPLHGLPVWLDAVEQVPDVHLTLFGGDRASRSAAVERLGDRLELRGPFEPLDRIREALEVCHLVCGIVGTSAKAGAVVPFKVVHALAHGRPVLTGDSPAVRELLDPGEDCLTAAPRGDAKALAQSLCDAAGQSGAELQRIGERARERFETAFSAAAVARRLQGALDAAVTSRGGEVPVGASTDRVSTAEVAPRVTVSCSGGIDERS